MPKLKNTFTKELFTKELFTKELFTKELFTKELFAKELFAKELFAKELFAKEIQKYIRSFKEKNQLQKAVSYALLSGGKRLRPLIVLLIAESVNKKAPVMPSALAVEFFHTASLIADDLPCMDNDAKRRNKPSLHKKFGESTAILASYALISAGYSMLFENAKLLSQKKIISENQAHFLCSQALKQVSEIAGINGAVGGQFLDLYPPSLKETTVLKIIEKKTAMLFELSFGLGFLFGGGDLKFLKVVKTCGSHLGMAFQLADDLHDLKQDKKNKTASEKKYTYSQHKLKERKANDGLNAALILGKEKTKTRLKWEINKFLEIKKLGLLTPALNALACKIKDFA